MRLKSVAIFSLWSVVLTGRHFLLRVLLSSTRGIHLIFTTHTSTDVQQYFQMQHCALPTLSTNWRISFFYGYGAAVKPRQWFLPLSGGTWWPVWAWPGRGTAWDPAPRSGRCLCGSGWSPTLGNSWPDPGGLLRSVCTAAKAPHTPGGTRSPPERRKVERQSVLSDWEETFLKRSMALTFRV